MNKLHDLSVLLASLEKNEVSSIKRLLVSENKAIPNPTSTLFELVLKKNDSGLSAFEKQFTKGQLSNLVQKLHNKVLDVLCSDETIESSSIYSSFGKAKLSIRKQILYAQVLGSRAQIKQVIVLLNKIVREAKSIELYDELLTCQYELANLYSATGRWEEFHSILAEIAYHEKIRNTSKEGFILYNRLTFALRKQPENTDTHQELERILPQLKSNYESSRSLLNGWFYYRLLIEYQQIREEYREGYISCRHLLQLQQNSAFLQNKTLISITYKMLAKFSMGLYLFDEALEYILLSKKNENHSSPNTEAIKSTEFYIYFYKADLTKARSLITELIKKSTGLSLAIYSFYSACCLFLEDKPTSHILEDLSQTKEIEKDKEGWNIHVRLLQIMHLCEGKKWDVAQAHIESLRKHLERTAKTKNIKPRFQAIFKALRELANCGFDFGKAWKKHPELFALLASETDETYRWRMLSPELIRFEAWFEAKARRLPYAEVFTERIKVRQAQNQADLPF